MRFLGDEEIVTAVYEALAKRHPNSRSRGRPAAPAELDIARAARAKGPESRDKLNSAYGKLLSSTSRVVGQAKRFAKEITEGVKRASDLMEQLALDALRQEIDDMAPRVWQVMKQTRARIYRGDTRAEGKIVSLFEPATEVIRKGKAAKPTEFGKMIKLQEAKNQIVIEYQVYDRRPNDCELLVPAIETHQATFGRVPHLLARSFLLRQKRGRRESQRRQTRVHSKSLNQEPRTQTRAEEALVPQRPEMAHRLRGAHQRRQAAAWSQPLPISGRRRHENAGSDLG
jgi:hypothetical protein